MNKAIHYATSKLRRYREDRNWTQQDMANYLSLQMGRDLSMSTVQKWEQGTLPVNANTALELSHATKIPVMELVMRKDV